MYGDAQRLRQVLINLVSNALRFTEHGSVTVRLGADPVTRIPTRIDVVDTGIGIPRERQAAIFEPFEQADRGTARRYGGTGLGLAISRSLCEMMGYRLEVQSEPGVGSTFSIVFPTRHVNHHRDTCADGTPRANGAFAGPDAPPLALVVDDDPDSRVLLGHLLEEYGCRVVSAVSAADGLRLAREQHPSVITVDLIMPAMGGWEMVERLQADPALRDASVIVVSIVASEESRPGMEHVQRLDKPVSRDELFAALAQTPAARAAARTQLETPAPSQYRGVRNGASA
jgi:CheY-like chemotaxis protein